MTGIEPASPAWEAGVLPMNYICTTLILYHVFWKIQVYFHIFVKIRNDFCVFLLEEGTPDEVFGNPREERTRSFLDKVL